MKFSLKKILSPSELKILRNVSLISIAVSLIIVVISWLFQIYNISKKTPELNPLLSNLNILPFDIEAHKLSAKRFMQSNNPQSAIPHLQRVIVLAPKDIISQKELADAYLEAGYYQKALDLYNQLTEKELQESVLTQIWARRGIANFFLDNKEQSALILKECLTRFPGSAEAACFLGQIEAANSDTSKSIEYLNKAIEIDSTYTEAWYQLSRIKMFQKNYIAARQLLLKALQIEPLHAKSHARLGMVYYYLNNPDLARTSYQTALALNPEDFNTHYNLGELYYSYYKDTVNALKEFKQTLALNPVHSDANFKTALICVKNGMIKESIKYFQDALVTAPQNLRILLQLAAAFEKLSLTTEAIQVYNKILDIDDLNSIARQKIKMLKEK
ncbi:MAG: tetratricopeptide repeat protein [Fibrobacter sp.]|nr:tetratricopeptide repeat protein [Fibrobacter sp.]